MTFEQWYAYMYPDLVGKKDDMYSQLKRCWQDATYYAYAEGYEDGEDSE